MIFLSIFLFFVFLVTSYRRCSALLSSQLARTLIKLSQASAVTTQHPHSALALAHVDRTVLALLSRIYIVSRDPQPTASAWYCSHSRSPRRLRLLRIWPASDPQQPCLRSLSSNKLSEERSFLHFVIGHVRERIAFAPRASSLYLRHIYCRAEAHRARACSG